MKHLPVNKEEIQLANQKFFDEKFHVGQEFTQDANHSCFGGRITYLVTRIEDDGSVYGVWKSGSFYELEQSDVE